MDDEKKQNSDTGAVLDPSSAYLGILAGVALAFQRGWTEGATTTTDNQPDPLPKKLTRYRHPCHEHKFFLMVNRFPRSVVCDNVHCKRPIQFSECFASCPRCALDICATCFSRPLAPGEIPVPLADSDSEVNDDTFFTPYRMRSKIDHVKLPVVKNRRHVNATQVPTAAQTPAQSETFAGVQQTQEEYDDDDEDDEEEDETFMPA